MKDVPVAIEDYFSKSDPLEDIPLNEHFFTRDNANERYPLFTIGPNGDPEEFVGNVAQMAELMTVFNLSPTSVEANQLANGLRAIGKFPPKGMLDVSREELSKMPVVTLLEVDGYEIPSKIRYLPLVYKMLQARFYKDNKKPIQSWELTREHFVECLVETSSDDLTSIKPRSSLLQVASY